MIDVIAHVRKHLPRCLAGVTAIPIEGEIENRGGLSVVFRLAFSGIERCQILGFNLAEYNSDYTGPIEFISPITLRWEGGVATCIFDSDIHGYHGQMGSSAKLRGRGDAVKFLCPQCQGDSFVVDVQFDYQDDLFDEFDPKEVPDVFHNIIICGTCSSCSQKTSLLDMDL